MDLRSGRFRAGGSGYAGPWTPLVIVVVIFFFFSMLCCGCQSRVVVVVVAVAVVAVADGRGDWCCVCIFFSGIYYFIALIAKID